MSVTRLRAYPEDPVGWHRDASLRFIDATHHKIDKLVYELYELTPEEVVTVDWSNPYQRIVPENQVPLAAFLADCVTMKPSRLCCTMGMSGEASTRVARRGVCLYKEPWVSIVLKFN